MIMNDLYDDYFIAQLDERVKTIEEKIFKKKKDIELTRAQKLLILRDTGILEFIHGLDLKIMKKPTFISLLLSEDEENIYKDLTYHLNTENSALTTERNYKQLKEFYTLIGLNNLAEKSDIMLDEISKKK